MPSHLHTHGNACGAAPVAAPAPFAGVARAGHAPAATALPRRLWLQRCGRALCVLAPLGGAVPARVAHADPAAGGSFYGVFDGMQLLDQDGKPLRATALLGRAVLLNFIFTACSTACPVQTHALAQLQRRLAPALRQRVRLVSVSLDALSDTPQRLKAFGQRHDADFSTWSFVTGRPGDVQRLAESLSLFRGGAAQAPLEDHSTTLWLIDAQGLLRGRLAGLPPDVPGLTRELQALLSTRTPAAAAR